MQGIGSPTINLLSSFVRSPERTLVQKKSEVLNSLLLKSSKKADTGSARKKSAPSLLISTIAIGRISG